MFLVKDKTGNLKICVNYIEAYKYLNILAKKKFYIICFPVLNIKDKRLDFICL